MPWWVSGIGVLLKALGLVDMADRLFERYQDRQQGRQQQRAADVEAANQEARDARQTETDVGRMSDSDLDSGLRRYERGGR